MFLKNILLQRSKQTCSQECERGRRERDSHTTFRFKIFISISGSRVNLNRRCFLDLSGSDVIRGNVQRVSFVIFPKALLKIVASSPPIPNSPPFPARNKS